MIEIEVKGKLYQADYVVEENVVTVCGYRDFQSTQFGGLSEDKVAKIPLRSLIKKVHVEPVV